MNEKNLSIIHIRCERGGEFIGTPFKSLCEKLDNFHEMSAPKTPQQNGVPERKNRTLQEMARAMLLSSDVPEFLWGEAINTTCYIANRVYFSPGTQLTLY